MKYIVCHYHEIALKGGNRSFFERKLVENIKKFLPEKSFEFVKRIPGRIIVKLTKKGIEEKNKMRNILRNVFGIANFSFAVKCKQEIGEINKASVQLLETQKFDSFRVSTKRANKQFKFNSQEVNEKVGAFIVQEMKKDVDLENFDQELTIEIVQDSAYIYLSKIEGRGGLPIGVSGKGLVLISGGIDSPVAAFLAMKRGIEVSLIHFYSFPYTKKEAVNKVKRITQTLTNFQFDLKLYLSPFANIQKKILLNAPAKLRVVLYRRMMTRIAEKIAGENNIQTLITGESVGQVASQTLENINAIRSAVGGLILRPLISWDKREIIEKAKDIETFEISILPYEDCCSRFVPKHPATKSNLDNVQKAEQEFNINQLVKKAVQNTELFKFNFREK